MNYAKCVKCDYVQPIRFTTDETKYNCSFCGTENRLAGRVLAMSGNQLVWQQPDMQNIILAQWDSAMINLYLDEQLFAGHVRLRNCALNFDDNINEYYLTYQELRFSLSHVELAGEAT